MTTTQHTPGPWRVYFESDAFDSAQSILRIIDPRGDDHPQGPLSIANINVVAFAPHLEEPLANARLIAAAPQMLEALRAALEPTTPETEGEQLRDQIAEAIAAATGGAK
jgi:hypothetical protein